MARPAVTGSRAQALGLVVVVSWLAGCATSLTPRAPSFVISDVVHEGDPTRRASTRLVLRGIDADASGDEARARADYERALQVDATNPYAFLALGRFEVEHGDAARASMMLDQAQALLQLERAPEGALVHVRGLRGALGAPDGSARTRALLDEARARAPDVWADGRLDARELR